MDRKLLDRLNQARRAKQPAVVATILGTGESHLFLPNGTGRDDARFMAGEDDLTAAAQTALREDRPATIDSAVGEIFLNPFNPPLRLIIVGAVHITQVLAPMARLAGFEVRVIDPRGAFAEAERFAEVTGEVEVIEDWPDDVLRQDPPDARTALVTLTHDPKLDDAALKEALASEAFYIGSLGSKKTHAARLERLRRADFDEAALSRIHGPVGLDIGAKSPAEIALAILGQVIETLRAE